MRRFSILIALAFALFHSFGDETTLRSVAQLSDFADRTPNTHVRFELTGTVLETDKSSRTNYAGIVLLEDSSGRAYAFYDGCGTPSPGDVPPLEFRLNLSPRDISRMEKRRVAGMTIAAWSDNCAMLRTRHGDPHRQQRREREVSLLGV